MNRTTIVYGRTRPQTMMERFDGSRETFEQMDREERISRIVDVLEGLTHRHSFEVTQPGSKDPSLTIEAMGKKPEILENLHLNLLPLFKSQLSSLLSSLDLIDPQKNPKPVTNPTLEALSHVDQTLEGIVSATVTLTLESPLPDEDHDHHLEKLKVFRFSLLRQNIQHFVRYLIYHQLFRDLKDFIEWCAMPDSVNEDEWILKEGSELREVIQTSMAFCHDTIDITINWCQKSDWALVQEAWLRAQDSFEESLKMFTCRTNRALISTMEADPRYDKNERSTKTKLIVQVAKSAIPLVKLGRIMVKKTSQAIAKKLISESGTELNSRTINQLYFTPVSIYSPLNKLANILYVFDRIAAVMRVDDQDDIRSSVQNLPKDMESTLADLTTFLFPFLPQIKNDSPGTQLKSFFPNLKQSWDKASDQLMDVISSFEVERVVI
ncbi:hypothetical protein PtA15_12A164 [Puccinia triticina]|uniref:Uncharacterized protein n=1 Tax=Puccinia triticina TaxID=208348 RepID=A0ABY7D0P7_9BASI|nr:uncharacterized protein PtA15_12A164 [Puccinia triticina]WAQ90178.1 hypothetical protein PtA15_12A164 [Puccinia triticina]